MNKHVMKKAAVALAIAVMINFLLLQVATACPTNLKCNNFTDKEKRADCDYIWSQTSRAERQEAICLLWDQEYGFPEYKNPKFPNATANFTFSPKEIETSRFALFCKIIILILFNYTLFCLLVNSSFIRKCLRVD